METERKVIWVSTKILSMYSENGLHVLNHYLGSQFLIKLWLCLESFFSGSHSPSIFFPSSQFLCACWERCRENEKANICYCHVSSSYRMGLGCGENESLQLYKLIFCFHTSMSRTASLTLTRSLSCKELVEKDSIPLLSGLFQSLLSAPSRKEKDTS